MKTKTFKQRDEHLFTIDTCRTNEKKLNIRNFVVYFREDGL